MILFILEIFNHIQIKQLLLFVFFLFLSFNNINKNTKTHPHTSFFIMIFLIHYLFTCKKKYQKFKLPKQHLNNSQNYITHSTQKKLHNSP